MQRLSFLAIVLAGSACGTDVGEDGSDLPFPYEALRGGFVFATSAIVGSAGYDLYWAPVPDGGDVSSVPFERLTDGSENDWQPSAALSGRGLAFARDSGIHVISSSGRVKRISDTRDSTFVDSLPAVSPDADRVAWVREDTSRPIGQTGYFEAYIMMAAFDGTNVREVQPSRGFVQDAPAFDPDLKRPRIGWSEFDPAGVVAAFGPRNYGIYVYDYVAEAGDFVCQSVDGITPGANAVTPPADGRSFRCFGQHLAWPLTDTLVLGQGLLEISTIGRPLASTYPGILDSMQSQQTGFPFTDPRPDGFHPPFPISVSFSNDARQLFLFDGVVGSVEGDQPTLGFFAARYDGGGLFRIRIAGLVEDIDTITTRDYLLSVATPAIIPSF
ncbi:MAG: hypothetical protein HYV07_30820 [Deltaproteobacteria bacterium]|nr:hypothetical protein [Deltaproteobacteria bacterium]